jgi:hypothetical protein
MQRLADRLGPTCALMNLARLRGLTAGPSPNLTSRILALTRKPRRAVPVLDGDSSTDIDLQ